MTVDLALFGAIVVAFAAWVTVHVLLAATLFLSARKRLAALAFFVPPAAPIIALRARERALGVAWLVAGAAYAVLLAWGRA